MAGVAGEAPACVRGEATGQADSREAGNEGAAVPVSGLECCWRVAGRMG